MKFSKKTRTILVIAFIVIYILCTYVSLRGQYLEQAELGSQYVEAFLTNIKYKYTIMGISFVILSISIYFNKYRNKKRTKTIF